MRRPATWVVLVLVPVIGMTAPATARADPGKSAPTPAIPSADASPDPETAPITPRQAADHLGEDVILEGRVHAVHVSRLATVLAFAPNFAGFTATIHAADRERFPKDLHETVRDRVVRLRGRVRTYRGRAEMTLSDPAQLVVVEAAGTPRSAAPAVSEALAEEVRESLTRIETRLDAIESRLATLERPPVAPAADERRQGLTVGMPASAAEATLGPPLEEVDDSHGLRVWIYEDGRTLTFDATARLIAWTGFGP